MSNYKTQVEAGTYQGKHYSTPERFLSYFEQVNAVTSLEDVRDVAEVGKGSGVTSSLLRNAGYDVTTIDFDKTLDPDVHSSILEVKDKVSKKFDAVCCFEVMEHLEYRDFAACLDNLASVSRKYVIISLPYAGYTVRVQFLVQKYGIRELKWVFRVPMFWRTHRFDGEHYWEVGKRGHSVEKTRRAISEKLNVTRTWKLPFNCSQVFFMCKVRGYGGGGCRTDGAW